MIGNVVAALIGLAVGGVICFFLGIRYRKTVSEKEISSAEEEGKRIINEAIKSAETKKKEALLEAKEEILKNRSEYEKEEKSRRADLQRQENRLQQKEENLDRKTEWVKGVLTAPDGTKSGTDNVAPNVIAVDSIREDEVPGIHSVIYDSEADCITIKHDAHSRKGFALGAVLAAEYAAKHEGFLTMQDLFHF